MKKLNKDQIKFIDNYLIKVDIKYIDARLELIDHLASEFEDNSKTTLLEDFLNAKRYFIKQFVDKRQSTIHWTYQKLLWKKFLEFTYKTPLIFASFFTGIGIHLILINLNPKQVSVLFALSIVVPQVLAVIMHGYKHKLFKKVQSAKPLLAIMALPSLFLYVYNLIGEPLSNNYHVMFAFWMVGFLLSLAGLMVLRNQRENILKKYKKVI